MSGISVENALNMLLCDKPFKKDCWDKISWTKIGFYKIEIQGEGEGCHKMVVIFFFDPKS